MATRVLAAPRKKTRKHGGVLRLCTLGVPRLVDCAMKSRNRGRSPGSRSCSNDCPCMFVLVMRRCFRQSETLCMRRSLSSKTSPSQMPRSIRRKLNMRASASELWNWARKVDFMQVSNVYENTTIMPVTTNCRKTLKTTCWMPSFPRKSAQSWPPVRTNCQAAVSLVFKAKAANAKRKAAKWTCKTMRSAWASLKNGSCKYKHITEA
mmetsp:Transcript_59341/g.138976  ORF Transcript_59341/g.138976 Transcript_59341/m.138976 type:complete len:207 (-) Transcript_59341:363-983(-)